MLSYMQSSCMSMGMSESDFLWPSVGHTMAEICEEFGGTLYTGNEVEPGWEPTNLLEVRLGTPNIAQYLEPPSPGMVYDWDELPAVSPLSAEPDSRDGELNLPAYPIPAPLCSVSPPSIALAHLGLVSPPSDGQDTSSDTCTSPSSPSDGQDTSSDTVVGPSSPRRVDKGKGREAPYPGWKPLPIAKPEPAVPPTQPVPAMVPPSPAPHAAATLHVKREELTVLLKHEPRGARKAATVTSSAAYMGPAPRGVKRKDSPSTPSSEPTSKKPRVIPEPLPQPLVITEDPQNEREYPCMLAECTERLRDTEDSASMHAKEHYPPRPRLSDATVDDLGRRLYRSTDRAVCLWRTDDRVCNNNILVGEMGRHILRHYSVTRYKCPLRSCDSSYSRIDSCYMHMQRKHHWKEVPAGEIDHP